jgi:hypothetical protein
MNGEFAVETGNDLQEGRCETRILTVASTMEDRQCEGAAITVILLLDICHPAMEYQSKLITDDELVRLHFS